MQPLLVLYTANTDLTLLSQPYVPVSFFNATLALLMAPASATHDSMDALAHLSYSTVADVLLQVQCVPPNPTRYEPTLWIAAPASLDDPGPD